MRDRRTSALAMPGNMGQPLPALGRPSAKTTRSRVRLPGARCLRSLPKHWQISVPAPAASPGDFLIALLRDLVASRRRRGSPLKVVIMSATLDAALFSGYFGSGCPALHARGRTFTVRKFFLEDVYQQTGALNSSSSASASAASASECRELTRRRLSHAAWDVLKGLRAGRGLGVL